MNISSGIRIRDENCWFVDIKQNTVCKQISICKIFNQTKEDNIRPSLFYWDLVFFLFLSEIFQLNTYYIPSCPTCSTIKNNYEENIQTSKKISDLYVVFVLNFTQHDLVHTYIFMKTCNGTAPSLSLLSLVRGILKFKVQNNDEINSTWPCLVTFWIQNEPGGTSNTIERNHHCRSYD